MESNPGLPKVAKVSKSTKAATNLNNNHDQNNSREDATTEAVEDRVEVRSVLERQAELISKQKDDLVELRKRLEENVR